MTPSSGAYWVITTYYCGTMGLCDTYRMVANVYTIPSSGNPTTGYATWDESINPAIYLKSDIELSGSGTEDEPYTIENY